MDRAASVVTFWRRGRLRSRGPVGGLRRLLRRSEAAFIALALPIGAIAGAATALQGDLVHAFQAAVYGLGDGERLSAVVAVDRYRLLAVLPVGALLLALLGRFLARGGRRSPIDVVEANALHGGVIPARDSLLVSVQTLISNGVGASVGLEAAYAQVGGGAASIVGRWVRLRRNDMRTLVAAGAGAAVGAAFGAPLTGTFYAFEIVLGAYTPSAIAPVAVASLAAAVTARSLGVPSYTISLASAGAISARDYALYGSLGLICGLLGIAIMKLVTLVERLARRLPIGDVVRLPVGAVALAGLAMASPQVLSAGHGAMHLALVDRLAIGTLVVLVCLKVTASAVSLGFGFRGGLFFASLFLGSLVGQLFAGLVTLLPDVVAIDSDDAAVVGMAALAVAVVGGPMTMSLLVLESTHDIPLTGTAIAASLCASALVRELFGFSFSTWRMHTRGETIRSARDVGWMRGLTAGRMMRQGVPTVDQHTTVAEFRRRFPLGATSQVVSVDGAGRYAGFVQTAAAHDAGIALDRPVADLAVLADDALAPDQDVRAVMEAFDALESDLLVVVDGKGAPLGVVSERHVHRRYVAQADKAQRDLYGE